MRHGYGQFKEATPEFLRFAKQFGASDILLNTPNLPAPGGKWQLKDLIKLRLSVEQEGLKLSALETVPTEFYDHIMLNGPRRDEQIENMIETVRNIARAGIRYSATTGCRPMLAFPDGGHTRRRHGHRVRLTTCAVHAAYTRPQILRRGDVGEPGALDKDHHPDSRRGGHSAWYPPLRPASR